MDFFARHHYYTLLWIIVDTACGVAWTADGAQCPRNRRKVVYFWEDSTDINTTKLKCLPKVGQLG